MSSTHPASFAFISLKLGSKASVIPGTSVLKDGYSNSPKGALVIQFGKTDIPDMSSSGAKAAAALAMKTGIVF